MKLFDVQNSVRQLVTILLDQENLIIFLIYKNEYDAEEAYFGLYSLFNNNEINLRFDFILDYNFIQLDDEHLIDQDSTVSLTIYDNCNEFILVPDIPIKHNIQMALRARSIAINHKEYRNLDSNYKFITLATVFLNENDIIMRYTFENGEVRGFTNINEILVFPSPDNFFRVDAPPL